MDLNAQGRTKLPDIAYRLKKDSLVVENIPPESCSLEAMNEFFKQFGSIVNIKVETRIQKALVQFGHYRDAQKAYEHPGSILGNRFVRVFWFREYDFPPAAGAPSSGAPPTVAPQQQHQQQYQQNYQQQPVYYQQPHYQQQQSYESPKTPQQIALEKSKHLLELQKTQETLIAKQIEEQKRIMTQLTTANLSPKDKKFLVEQLKILTSATQNMVEKAAEQTQLVKTQTSTANANAKGLLDIEKERLDRELDLLSQLSAKAGDSGTVDPALQAKLDALQKEAQTLGVLPGSPSFRGGRGGARGGRGGGRGGAIVATRSFVLDNRARKIIVTGTSDNFLEALQEHSQVCISQL